MSGEKPSGFDPKRSALHPTLREVTRQVTKDGRDTPTQVTTYEGIEDFALKPVRQTLLEKLIDIFRGRKVKRVYGANVKDYKHPGSRI